MVFSEGGWAFLSVRDSVMGSCSVCIYSTAARCMQEHVGVPTVSYRTAAQSFNKWYQLQCQTARQGPKLTHSLAPLWCIPC